MKILIVLLLAGSLYAAGPAEDGISPINESIVVTAQFAPERARDSVYPVAVLDQDRIAGSASVNLDELLRFRSGYALDQHSVFGSAPTVRGISGENVKILLDGVPIVGRLNGIIDLNQLSLNGIERVELVEGPASIYYGSDALGGVINLVPAESDRQGLNFEIQTRFDDLGDRVLEPSIQWRNGNHGLMLDLGRKQFDGQDHDHSDRARDWHRRDQSQAGFRYNLYLQNTTITYDGRFYDETLEAYANAVDGVAVDTDYQTRRNIHQLRLASSISERIHLESSLSYSDYRRDLQDMEVVVADNSRTALPDSFDRTEFEHIQLRSILTTSNLWRSMDVQLGLEAQREQASGSRLDQDSEDMEEAALFANLRIEPFEWLIIQPSVRVAHHNVYDSPVIPALHLLGNTSAGQTRAWFGKGFRGPSSKQLYLDFTMNAGPMTYHITGNDLLEPEKSGHAGLSHSWIGSSDNRTLEITGELFYNDIDNLIALGALLPAPGRPGVFERSYLNINRHRTRGGQLSSELIFEHFSLGGSLTYTQAYNLLSETYQTPSYTNTLDGDLRLNTDIAGFRWNLFYRYNGERDGFYVPRGSKEARATLLDSWNMVDASISRNLFRNQLRVQLGARNLLNVDNLESMDLTAGSAHATNLIGPGRSFFLNLAWTPGR